MAKLIGQARGLQKAGDAERDPADLTPASPPTGGKASVPASPPASTPASEPASIAASLPASGNASVKTSAKASRNTSGKPGGKASTKSGGTASGKGRRLGRPPGPDRAALSVRILAELDTALTAAVADTGLSPQYVVDAALAAWLTDRGYLVDTHGHDRPAPG